MSISLTNSTKVSRIDNPQRVLCCTLQFGVTFLEYIRFWLKEFTVSKSSAAKRLGQLLTDLATCWPQAERKESWIKTCKSLGQPGGCSQSRIGIRKLAAKTPERVSSQNSIVEYCGYNRGVVQDRPWTWLPALDKDWSTDKWSEIRVFSWLWFKMGGTKWTQIFMSCLYVTCSSHTSFLAYYSFEQFPRSMMLMLTQNSYLTSYLLRIPYILWRKWRKQLAMSGVRESLHLPMSSLHLTHQVTLWLFVT